MTRLRTVLLGAGKSGRLFAAALSEHPAVNLCAVVSRTSASAQVVASAAGCLALAAQDDWISPRPDLVVVATPHHLHHRQVIRALQSGASVLCDKPVALSPSERNAITAAAERHGGRVYCSMVQRCSEAALECRQYLRDERARISFVGIQQILARARPYYETWKGRRDQAGGGVLINQAIHALDLAQFVTDSEFRLDSCLSWTSRDVEVETAMSAALTLGPNVPVLLTATTASAIDEQQVIRVSLGDELVLVVGSEVVSWGCVRSSDEVESVIAELAVGGNVYGPGYRGAVDDVVTSLLNGAASRYGIEMDQTASTHNLVFEIYQRLARERSP